jgi:hypothetical protein
MPLHELDGQNRGIHNDIVFAAHATGSQQLKSAAFMQKV